MADLVTKSCDVCGAIKTENSNWFVAYAMGSGLLIAPEESKTTIHAAEFKRQDLCGKACVIKKLSTTLSLDKLDKRFSIQPLLSNT